MVLAVIDGDADVLQRKAGQRAFRQHLAYAFFHRRDELTRDRPAHDVVDELESRAALQRLDAQEHLAELSGAAGLLLVAAVAVGWAGHGLPVRDAGRMSLHVHAVALTH